MTSLCSIDILRSLKSPTRLIFFTVFAAAMMLSLAAFAVGEITGIKRYPLKTYNEEGRVVGSLTKEQIGVAPTALSIKGYLARFRLLLIQVGNDQYLVRMADLELADPALWRRAMGASADPDALQCLGGGRSTSGAVTQDKKGSMGISPC